MKATPTDWFAVAVALWRADGNFLLPWEGYAEHFSDPPVLDGHEPGQAPIVLDVIREQQETTITAMLNYACDEARREAYWN